MKSGMLIGVPAGLAVGVTYGATSGPPHVAAAAILVLLGALFAMVLLVKLLIAIFT